MVLFLLMSFSHMGSMVLVLRGVGPILGIAASLQGSEMSLGLHCKNLILGICFKIR